jgi:tetratricopeptide (TPR) repeat protein
MIFTWSSVLCSEWDTPNVNRVNSRQKELACPLKDMRMVWVKGGGESKGLEAHLESTARLVGKAAFLLGEHEQSERAYNKAIAFDATLPSAWKGLVELYTADDEEAKLLPALEKLVHTSLATSFLQLANFSPMALRCHCM